MRKEMLAEVNERRRLDPALCLLMWATALNGDVPREALKALGVYHDELYSIFGGHEQEMSKLRQLRMVGEILNREFLAKLLRARMAELLMTCSKASDFASLMRAVKIMPEWVLDEAPGRDMRTEDPAFDELMDQPLEDEDGERVAPDFGTLAAAGPLLAERIYEQLRQNRAPGEVVAAEDGEVAENIEMAAENGNPPDPTWKGSPTPSAETAEDGGATHVSPVDSEPCGANDNGDGPNENVGAGLRPAQDDAVVLGAHSCAPQQPGG